MAFFIAFFELYIAQLLLLILSSAQECIVHEFLLIHACEFHLISFLATLFALLFCFTVFLPYSFHLLSFSHFPGYPGYTRRRFL